LIVYNEFYYLYLIQQIKTSRYWIETDKLKVLLKTKSSIYIITYNYYL